MESEHGAQAASTAFRRMRLLLQEPGATKILSAIALNQAKRFKLVRRQRGGNRNLAKGIDTLVDHVYGCYKQIVPTIGDIQGKVGLEIGPGDNLGLADCFLANGAKSMYAVEQFATVQWSEELRKRIYSSFTSAPRMRPDLIVCKFEQSSLRDLDFIYSVDVMEHVLDLRQVFRQAYLSLKPGGMFVNAIDLRGHNAFNLPSTPLNFLVCGDWLYNLMHSNIVSSNRCRLGRVIDALKREGFVVKSVLPTVQADENYVRQVRPHLLPRFRSIPESELTILETLVAAQKPLEPGDAAADAGDQPGCDPD